MEKEKLAIAQMLNEHPIKSEKELYRVNYINVLEYFVKKYSSNDIWANSVLDLYKKKLLDNPASYQYVCQDIKKISKKVLATKFKPFKLFSYRFCLIMDCVFMNAFNDREKADGIFGELVTLYNKRYLKNITFVYEALFDTDKNLDGFDSIQYMWDCWKTNREYQKLNDIRILVTANMSAGKSTLLNAIIGKKVNRTQNDSCTAKIHYLINKAYEDKLDYEWDYELNLDADYQTLMDDNESNESPEISVGTRFRSPIQQAKNSIYFIDTPGVNSSQDEVHRKITEDAVVKADSDILLYLMNGENIGTEDDLKHLQFIKENYNNGPILFVVNKLDRFRKSDSVTDTLQKVTEDLKQIGFENPWVVPISSYAGYLAKMKIYGEEMNEDEGDEFESLSRKLSRDEYQFDKYYPEDAQKKVTVDESIEGYSLLKHSGVLQLETILYGI